MGEKSLVACQACEWSQWHRDRNDLVQAGTDHLTERHPPVAVQQQPAAEILRLLEEALTPRCCHISGTHDPLHYREGRYLCQSQIAAAWHRAVLLLGLRHLDDAASAVADPETCYFCHKEQQTDGDDEGTMRGRDERAPARRVAARHRRREKDLMPDRPERKARLLVFCEDCPDDYCCHPPDLIKWHPDRNQWLCEECWHEAWETPVDWDAGIRLDEWIRRETPTLPWWTASLEMG